MGTYLLIWNPSLWHWTEEEVQDYIARLEKLGPAELRDDPGSRWSLGTNYRRIQTGDRLFLMRLGSEPRGIFASGYAVSEPEEDHHWDGVAGHKAWYVDVRWDTMANPYDAKSMLLREELEFISTEQRWTPPASGERIEEETAAKLEDVWRSFSGTSSEGK